MKFRFTLVAALALLSGTAWSAETGFYVGAGVGMSDLSGGGFSGNDFAFKVFGGYEVNKYFAVEGGYLDGGSPSDHGFNIDFNGWDLVAIGKLPLANNFDIHARLGWVTWDAKASGGGYGSHFGHDSGDDLLYGVGVGYLLTDQVGVTGDWERMDISGTDSADLWTVALTWKF